MSPGNLRAPPSTPIKTESPTPLCLHTLSTALYPRACSVAPGTRCNFQVLKVINLYLFFFFFKVSHWLLLQGLLQSQWEPQGPVLVQNRPSHSVLDLAPTGATLSLVHGPLHSLMLLSETLQLPGVWRLRVDIVKWEALSAMSRAWRLRAALRPGCWEPRAPRVQAVSTCEVAFWAVVVLSSWFMCHFMCL